MAPSAGICEWAAALTVLPVGGGPNQERVSGHPGAWALPSSCPGHQAPCVGSRLSERLQTARPGSPQPPPSPIDQVPGATFPCSLLPHTSLLLPAPWDWARCFSSAAFRLGSAPVSNVLTWLSDGRLPPRGFTASYPHGQVQVAECHYGVNRLLSSPRSHLFMTNAPCSVWES